ncbi:unnamed protein product [Umbelopsis ramanniana]
MNLEELTNSIEFALVEKQVLDGLQKGNEVLKEIHKEMSVEAVQKLMDDTADAIEYQNEIDEILSGNLTAEDEEDVLRELDELQQQELEAQMPAVPDAVPAGMEHREGEEELPAVPSHNPLETRPTKTKGERQAESKQAEGMLLA